MNRFALTCVIVVFCSIPRLSLAQTESTKSPPKPNDSRLGKLTTLNGYFPFSVPESKAAWEIRSAQLKRRILVATGLWPLPERTPLHAVIHGKTERPRVVDGDLDQPGFTVEKVYFESMPNHFVTGMLFRPDDGKSGKRPVVLSPHGHGGRLQDYGELKVRELIADGAERFEASGRFPKLARCAHLARMGCIVFIYDMLGYADSQQISRELAHGYRKSRPEFEGKDEWGLFSAQAEMRFQSVMGIQTWNSIRCLDFLLDLPDADPTRVGVTGGSGGGTQTILLCAIDDRPTVAFPNGMVSTSMQGGCTCENCTLLRVGTGNVELAALFAPKPQAMTAANDWTRRMMTEGYPTLQKLYEMVGKKEDVYCRELLHFPHNFNAVSRATMYQWMNKHLQLGHQDPFLEIDYLPIFPAEASVWDEQDHKQPEGGDKYELSLTKYMATESDKQIAALTPNNESSFHEYRRIVGGAFDAVIGRELPASADTQWLKATEETRDAYLYFDGMVRLESKKEEVPIVSLYPTASEWNGDAVIWLSDSGKSSLFDSDGKLVVAASRLLKGGAAILAPDLFQQGDFLDGDAPIERQRVVENGREAAAYTFCYNDTLFARRVHDIMTLIAHAKGLRARNAKTNYSPGPRRCGSGRWRCSSTRRRRRSTLCFADWRFSVRGYPNLP